MYLYMYIYIYMYMFVYNSLHDISYIYIHDILQYRNPIRYPPCPLVNRSSIIGSPRPALDLRPPAALSTIFRERRGHPFGKAGGSREKSPETNGNGTERHSECGNVMVTSENQGESCEVGNYKDTYRIDKEHQWQNMDWFHQWLDFPLEDVRTSMT